MTLFGIDMADKSYIPEHSILSLKKKKLVRFYKKYLFSRLIEATN
jgi:hypothetical protein